MKRITACLLIACLALTLFSACGAEVPSPQNTAGTTEAAEVTGEIQTVPEESAESPAEESASAPASEPAVPEKPAAEMIDMPSLLKEHDVNEIALTINGVEINWGEYYYWLAQGVNYVGSFIDMYKQYGMEITWQDYLEEDLTMAEFVIEYAEENILQIAAIKLVAEENGVELGDDTEEHYIQQKTFAAYEILGPDATMEEFDEFLLEEYGGDMGIRSAIIHSFLWEETLKEIYGEKGEKIENLDGVLNEHEVWRANHILLMTTDLDESGIEEKKALADKIYTELSAIKDKKALVERFEELKEEYCEDTGKVSYPHGYTFEKGVMVSSFEDTTKELPVYGLSEPVESEYGYHIILRMPYDGEETVLTGNSYLSGSTTGYYAAYLLYEELTMSKIETLNIERAAGFDGIKIADYILEK